MLTTWVRRLLLLIAVVVVVVAGIGIGRTASDDTRALCAEFTDASGLFEGNAVAMLGKKVGSVVGVHQNKGQSGVRIDMQVDKSVPLSADVGATMVSTSIVTERQIEFTKPYSGGARYETNQCIPLSKTRTPLGVSQTLDSISNLSEDLVKDNGRNTDAVLQSLKLVARNLEGTQGDVSGIIKDSATLINDPAKRDGQVRRIVGNLATLTGVATENDKELTALFDNFVGAINVIVAFGQTFGAAVEYAGTFVPILSRLATDFGPPIFAIGDAAVPLIAGMGEQPDMVAAVAARTADLIMKHPDAKSIVQAFAVSLPLRSLVSGCAAPVANGVCGPGDASRTIAGMMGGGA
ncbi:phospholipid/cholesterol/gamma-HCH transport system substrate-binding protein [Williamsia limnetica]|uniref:Phospholipid/cholesterol/gamma-HCH transport system substrate-binding protein n=1 Tax=Williamsia limnetica TaxID=882452 RepID=A0A318RD51_WILLI|nr:MlaD family protein [Williamsia limnetica]PYE13532.1 phospholipid/cholesterol/gamma-HCH transport system substrate-binding protein [Williamsia limnetica]